MKTKCILITMTALVILSMAALSMHAGNMSQTVIVYRTSQQETNDTPTTNQGRRLPTAPRECIISTENVTIPGVATSEVLTYEILNEDGILIFSTASEENFIECFFSLLEDIEIRLHTESSTYIGFTSME